MTPQEEQRIIDAMNEKKAEADFAVVVTRDDIRGKKYSFSAGQYFEVDIEYVDITAEEFAGKMDVHQRKLQEYFTHSSLLERQILEQLKGLKYENN